MRRFTGLFAIFAILLSLASAQAQTYTQSINFETSDQSMWASGLGTAGYSYDLNLISSWEYHGKKRRYKEIWLVGDFGGTVVVDTKGSAGLKINAFATSGHVDVVYPITLRLNYPDPTTLEPGEQFTVFSSWVPDRNAETPASLTTRSPNAGFSVRDIINLDQASVEFRAKAFSRTILHGWLGVPPFQVDEELFNTDELTEGDLPFPKKYENILSGSYHKPAVDTSGELAATARNLVSGDEDAFLTVRGDISNALAIAAGLPPKTFHGSEEEGFKYANAFVEWSFLDLFGEFNLKLAQNFNFTPKPMVTLTLSSGDPVTFEAGQSVQLTMPTDGSPLTITPTVELDNQFTNRTHVKLNNTLDFIVARVEAGAQVRGLFTKSVSFQPLDTFRLFDVDFLDVDVYNTAFKLGGFSMQTLPPLTIDRTISVPPSPLVANDDGPYSAREDSVFGFTSIVDADAANGVLANDTGPTGFHAVAATLTDSNGTLVLQSDGSFHFSCSTPLFGTNRYSFTYTITDGNGNTATAKINVTASGMFSFPF